MKTLRYFILLLFVYSVFSFIPLFAENSADHNLWYKEQQWLMLNQEKKVWKKLKTIEEKEDFIKKFYEARDADTFTHENEFQLNYQENLNGARKSYAKLDDYRRYIYLLLGKPSLKRAFRDQVVIITNPANIRIRIGKGEIWKYKISQQKYQVIFANISPYQLQLTKDKREEQQNPGLLNSSKYEILYVGQDRYTNISDFLESFFQENFRLKRSSITLDDLKKQILDRAKDFYKNSTAEVKKNKYSCDLEEKTVQALIYFFNIPSSNDSGMAIWLLFDKSTLNFKKKRYLANLSLFCELRDANDKQIIYYRNDDVEYELKTKKDYFYYFWGSAPPGKYKLILEIGENIGKKYKKIEIDIEIPDYSKPELSANFLLGRMVKDSDKSFKKKPGYFSLFCPVFGRKYFKDQDDLVVIFDFAGFHKNHYGYSYVEFALMFVNGELEQGKFVSNQKTYNYKFPSLETGSYFQGSVKFKIKDLVEKLKITQGLYKIKLFVYDKVAGKSVVKEYCRPIIILSVESLKKLTKE